MATIGEVTVKLNVPTDALVVMRDYHLKAAGDIGDTLNRLQTIGKDAALRERWKAECQEAYDADDEIVMPTFEHWKQQQEATDAEQP